MDKDIRKGIIYALLSALFGAYPYIFNRYVLQRPENYPVEFVCGLYHLFAAGLFVLFFLATGRMSRLRVPTSALKWLLGMCALETLSMLAWFAALQAMDPTLVSFFNNSQTIFIILLSAVFLGERFNRLEGLGTCVALTGVFLISFHAARPEMRGMLLTILSALLFSCTVVLVKKAMGHLSPLTMAFYRALSIAVCFCVLSLATGRWVQPDGATMGVIALGALFGPFLNILFYFAAMKNFDASKVSLIRAAQPIFVLLNAALILNTVPGPLQILGGLVIIAGLYILVMGRERSVSALLSVTNKNRRIIP